MKNKIATFSSPHNKAEFPWKPLHGVLNRDHRNCKCMCVLQGLLIIGKTYPVRI